MCKKEANNTTTSVGVHSPRLAERFQHVLVSDIIPSNVDIARARLPSPAYRFKTSSLEDTVDLEADSMDLVFASTMMHFTDTVRAVDAVRHQLKPGGTFAAGLYGTYALHDAAAQPIWQKIVLWICESIIRSYGLDDRAKSILRHEASGLDGVGLPWGEWEKVERYEYNFPERRTMRDMILPKQYGLEPITRVGSDDKVEAGVWDKGWFSKEDINGLKGIASTWPHEENDPEIIALWDELKEVIGEGEVEGAWMVCLLLATKR